jgi:RNA polymerase sigma-70 factor (ECF subfamily)
MHYDVIPSDRTLVARIAAGDHDAFDELYRRHIRPVRAQARKLCAGRELAEDVAQEAFLSIWRSAHSYHPARGTVGAWVSSVVRNRAIDAWRRASVRPIEVEAFERHVDDRAPLAPAPDPERPVLLALIAALPAAQKEAVFLAYYAGLSQSEIAQRGGAPLGTVKGRLRLGLEKLRSGLDEQPALAA